MNLRTSQKRQHLCQKYLTIESALVPIAFGPRRITPALKELASMDSRQVRSHADIPIGEDSLDNNVE